MFCFLLTVFSYITMFLDISFIGAASYRKEGYSKVYKALRRQRRQSICIEDSKANQILDEKYDSNQNYITLDNLNVTLPHYFVESDLQGDFDGHSKSRLSKNVKHKKEKDRKSSIFEKYNRYKATSMKKVSVMKNEKIIMLRTT